MRLSSLSVTAVLLFSSIAFAQHHDTTSAPAPSSAPAPAPSPATSAAPTPAPSPPSPSPAGPSPAATESHVSAPSSAPASLPESHSAPGVSFSNPTSTSVSNNLNSERSTPVPHASESDSRIIPERKISAEDKIVSAPRVGEESAAKESAAKPAESDLRRRICDGEPCKGPAAKTPAESDLRRPCLKEPCTCSPGQTLTKGGCVTTVVNNSGQCQTGQVWNGGSCLTPVQCPANAYWNGANCTTNGAACATINGRAAMDINELRGLKGRTREACSEDPSGQECSNLTQELNGATLRYRMLLNEASPTCRTTLPDPDSL
jgi:hypothetical protein